MSASAIKVAEQLLQDNVRTYVSVINKHLDEQDAVLMLRGRKDMEEGGDNDVGEPWSYRNHLRQYIVLLTIISQKEFLKQKYLARYIQKLDLFLPLDDIIRAIPANIYNKVIIKVQVTLASRYDYFVRLMKSLPMEQCTPTDVAWFNRENHLLISKYLQEHPDNTVLLMKESEQVKRTCDLKAIQLSVYQKVKSICIQLRKSTRLFQSQFDHEVSNYYIYILLSPLKALADNKDLLNNPRPLMSALLHVYWDFDKKNRIFCQSSFISSPGLYKIS